MRRWYVYLEISQGSQYLYIHYSTMHYIKNTFQFRNQHLKFSREWGCSIEFFIQTIMRGPIRLDENSRSFATHIETS
jgi:hypothetical protein